MNRNIPLNLTRKQFRKQSPNSLLTPYNVEGYPLERCHHHFQQQQEKPSRSHSSQTIPLWQPQQWSRVLLPAPGLWHCPFLLPAPGRVWHIRKPGHDGSPGSAECSHPTTAQAKHYQAHEQDGAQGDLKLSQNLSGCTQVSGLN